MVNDFKMNNPTMNSSIRIAMAQMNSTLGDFKSNAEKILHFTHESLNQNCHLVIFPEACLFGYPPMDLLERPEIVQRQEEMITWLNHKIPKEISVLIGAITKNNGPLGKPYHNSAILINPPHPLKFFSKQLLPNYDVFDEERYFEPGILVENIFTLENQKVLVTICEDIWDANNWDTNNRNIHAQSMNTGDDAGTLDTCDFESHPQQGFKYKRNPLEEIRHESIDLIINLSASPFTHQKAEMRYSITRTIAQQLKAPLIYVNLVGGQDELIFDGGSFVMTPHGTIHTQSAYFKEDLNIFNLCDLDLLKSFHLKETSSSQTSSPQDSPLQALPFHKTKKLRQALVMGLRDFVHKTGFQHVHLGLSGGIDSALVACLAVESFGPHHVTAFAMPSPFNSQESFVWAKKLANTLKINLKVLPISESYQCVLNSYENCFGPMAFSLVHENIQSRLRSLFLMAYSNHKKSLLLNTSNKSEMAVGYSTLYGDLSGGLCPIGDLLKRDIYELCKLYNKSKGWIPHEILERPPSAELRPNQKDEDSLPPYSKLDTYVERQVEQKVPPTTAVEKDVLKMLYKSEFKRWQAPPILKVTQRSFGRGRRFPIAGKWVDLYDT